MQKDDDKYNDNNYHHDGEVDGLHIEVDLHDQIPTSTPLASAFQRLQSGALSLPPPMKRLFPFSFCYIAQQFDIAQQFNIALDQSDLLWGLRRAKSFFVHHGSSLHHLSTQEPLLWSAVSFS